MRDRPEATERDLEAGERNKKREKKRERNGERKEKRKEKEYERETLILIEVIIKYYFFF